MTRCYWCPNCGWVETGHTRVYSCENVCDRGYRYDFGFNPAIAEWREDRDDLAMALELACFLEFEWHVSGKSDGNKNVADWLRAKTMIALRGER